MKIKIVSGMGIARFAALFFVLFSILSSGVLSSTIESRFSCDNINSTTTYHTYLRESKLVESGYTTGFKTGSFNYFKGPKAVINDRQIYYDGAVDGDHPVTADDHNASVSHILTVDFIGEKGNATGISEFFAKGYYTDNRAVSAWKKIWDANKDYPSNNITVRAAATMNMKGIYDLKYNAKAENAYAIYTDKVGYSNKTGARRIEWEQSGLMTGEKVQFINDLKASSAYKPRAPGADWLPCTCFSGTIPAIEPIEGKDSEWPSREALAMLEPAQRLPTAACTPYGCKKCPDGSDNCTVCSLPNCNNFPGVYGYGSGISSSGVNMDLPKLPQVLVESYYVENEEDVTEYAISVRNLGTSELTEVIAYVDITNTNAYVPRSATINGEPTVPVPSEDKKTLAFKLDNLQAEAGPTGIKAIVMRINTTVLGDGFNRDKVMAFVSYKTGTSQEKTTPVESIGIQPHDALGV